MLAGTSTQWTIVASIRSATATPKPTCCVSERLLLAKPNFSP
jgi:hypothetical protein